MKVGYLSFSNMCQNGQIKISNVTREQFYNLVKYN